MGPEQQWAKSIQVNIEKKAKNFVVFSQMANIVDPMKE